MSHAMNLFGSKEGVEGYPCLFTDEQGTVLSLESGYHLRRLRDCLACYNAPKSGEFMSSSQHDIPSVMRAIAAVDDEGGFESIYAKWVPRCLEYSYCIELLGGHSSFWDDSLSHLVEEFCEEAFGYRLDGTIEEAKTMVKPMEEWPVGRRVAPDKLRLMVNINTHNVGVLSFTERSIVFTYMGEDGVKKSIYLGFPDYTELGVVSIGYYDWYSACWKHLFYQVLCCCGIYHDEFQFFFAEELCAQDIADYKYDGQGIKPIRVRCPEDIIREVEDYLEVRKDSRIIFHD